MYQFPAAQQTITTKLTASSRGLKLKSWLYRLMGLRLLMKMLLKETILGVNLVKNIAKTKKPCFVFFWRFGRRALKLRLGNKYIYVF